MPWPAPPGMKETLPGQRGKRSLTVASQLAVFTARADLSGHCASACYGISPSPGRTRGRLRKVLMRLRKIFCAFVTGRWRGGVRKPSVHVSVERVLLRTKRTGCGLEDHVARGCKGLSGFCDSNPKCRLRRPPRRLTGRLGAPPLTWPAAVRCGLSTVQSQFARGERVADYETNWCSQRNELFRLIFSAVGGRLRASKMWIWLRL
jgi:hypothetical protein